MVHWTYTQYTQRLHGCCGDVRFYDKVCLPAISSPTVTEGLICKRETVYREATVQNTNLLSYMLSLEVEEKFMKLRWNKLDYDNCHSLHN